MEPPNPFGDPPLELQLRVCSEGADAFVASFYQDINSGKSLSAYYIDASTLYAAVNESADIVINGAHLHSSAEYEALLLEQRGGPDADLAVTTTTKPLPTNGHHRPSNSSSSGRPRVRYEVSSYDAQPVNFEFQIARPDALPQNETAYGGGCISMLLSVMGTLHIDNGSDEFDDDDDDGATTTETGPEQQHPITTTTHTTFADVFVLWPNWQARGRGAAARREKNKFLIASQNYRAL